MLDAYTKIFDEIVRRSGDVFSAPLKLSVTSKMSLLMKINYLKIGAKLSADSGENMECNIGQQEKRH